MKPVSGRRFCKALARHGWTFDRISGSHHIYIKPGHGSISVPVHGDRDLATGTQRKLMEAGRAD